MEVDGVRRPQVERVGAASTDGGHSHDHRLGQPAGGGQQVFDRLLCHQRKIARQQQHALSAGLCRTRDAALGCHVLAFLARLDQDLGPELRRQRRDLIASSHHQHVVTRRGGSNRARRVGAREGTAFGGIERRAQSLFGRAKVFDEHDDPGAHLLPHRSRMRGRICEPYSFMNRAWSLPGA